MVDQAEVELIGVVLIQVEQVIVPLHQFHKEIQVEAEVARMVAAVAVVIV